IESRSKLEKIQNHGRPMAIDEVVNLFVQHFPREFNPFRVEFTHYTNELKLTFKCALSENEQQEIQLICESLGYQGYRYIFHSDSSIQDYPGKIDFKPNTYGNRQLIASGLIQKQFPRKLLERYEEDEDFWVQNRHSVFSDE